MPGGEIHRIDGVEYALADGRLTNTQVSLPGVRFPAAPPVHQASAAEVPEAEARRRGYRYTAVVVLALPQAEVLVQSVSAALIKALELFKGWTWYSTKIWEAAERIPVRFWFDKRAFKVEWVLIPPGQESGLGALPLALVAPILLGLAAALAALGFLIISIRVDKPGPALTKIAVIALAGLGILALSSK